MNTIFADISSNISVAAGVVRIDYANFSQTDKESGQARFAHSHTMAMPLEGFLRSLEMQEKIREELIEKGVIKPNISRDETQESSKE